MKVKGTTFLPAASCLPFMEGKQLIVLGGLQVTSCGHQLLDKRLCSQCSLHGYRKGFVFTNGI